MSRLQLDALREKLLVAGVAPRHVRRYLGELRHHFDDLLHAETGNGLSGEAAMRAARARLGSDERLANAMLAKPGARSMTGRYPWLVFGLLPPLGVIVGFALVVVATQLVAIQGGAYIPRQGFVAPSPA
jgi:hypothetical protein